MDVQYLGKHETAELGALQHLGATGGITQQQESPSGGVVGQKVKHQPVDDDTAIGAPATASKADNERLRLTRNERLIIRNYRAMKKSVQLTFVDISEELALALPAVGPAGAAASAQGR